MIFLHLKSLNRDQEVGPGKCVVFLKIPYINKNSAFLETNIKRITRHTYFAAKPRVTFTSKPLLIPAGKDLIPKFDKSMVIYQYKCYCDSSYIGLTSRQLKKRIKEHVPKCVRDYMVLTEEEKKTKKSIKINNSVKRSGIAEHLVNNDKCAENFNFDRFEIVKNCANISELIKLEAICIMLRKPKLCRQQEFDYVVSLFP